MFVILNSDEVRAVLNGSKTGHQIPIIYRGHWSVDEREDGILWPLDCTWTHGEDGEPWLRCPYAPGSRVWVREGWASAYNGNMGTLYRADKAFIQAPIKSWEEGHSLPIWHEHKTGPHYSGSDPPAWMRWRSPVTMPRWASRLELETTAVRVIRVDGVWHWDVDWRTV